MTWTDAADLAGALLLLLGSLLTVVAAIGIVRFGDLLSRMHAATKPQTLGLLLLMAGLALIVRDAFVVWTLLLVVVGQMVTAPISAHMVGRAGYRTRRIDPERMTVDELTEDLEAVARLSDAEVARRLARTRQPRDQG